MKKQILIGTSLLTTIVIFLIIFSFGTLTLNNLEIQSTQFIVLGNKFDYNNRETIKFKFTN